MSQKIMLVCSAGMSTSLLVSKMKNYIAEEGLDYSVVAIASTEAIEYARAEQVDVILLGPQVRFLENNFKKELSVPIEMIKPQDYGSMNGKNVVAQAQRLLNQ